MNKEYPFYQTPTFIGGAVTKEYLMKESLDEFKEKKAKLEGKLAILVTEFCKEHGIEPCDVSWGRISAGVGDKLDIKLEIRIR